MKVSTFMNLPRYQKRLSSLSPAGYYIALRVGFYAPEFELNLFSKDWIDHYTSSGHALADPFLFWCHQNEGYARWSDIKNLCCSEIFRDYQYFGYKFGGVFSIRGTASVKKRSLGIFARFDRELFDEEMNEIMKIIHDLHSHEAVTLTDAQLDAFRLYSQGYLQKQIAHELGVSVSAVKARLRGGADRLEARTLREAALIAANRGLL